MKRRLTGISLSVFIPVILTGVIANAQEYNLHGEIPFDFVVGDVTMKAGHYDISKISLVNNVFMVQARSMNDRAGRFAYEMYRRNRSQGYLLVFNRYKENGGEVITFLSEIRVAGEKFGFRFYKHRAEREAEARAQSRDTIALSVSRIDNRVK